MAKPSIRERFPPPWQAIEMASGYQITASNGRAVAYVYGEAETTRRAILNQPTPEEALAIAKAIAQLPALMPDIQPPNKKAPHRE
jgi:hypothetical protein